MTQTGPDDDIPVAAQHGAFSPFRYPVYRAIWSANLFSNLGATIQAVAAAWLMTELTGSNRMIAAVQASTTLPILLFGMFAGAIADNFDRRRVMLAAQAGMLTVSSALAVLAWAGLVGPLTLLALTVLVGTGTALNAPAWQSSVRQTVPDGHLPQAIALNSMSFNIARSAGPALGGLLLSLWGASLAFAINAVSYVAIIIVLLRWRPEPRDVIRRPMFPAIGVALRYCLSSGPVRRLLIRGCFMGFGISAYLALMPAMVRLKLRGDEMDYGIMLAVFGIGSIVAAPFVGRLRERIDLEGVLAVSVVFYVLAMSILAEAHAVVWAAPVALLAGMAWVAVMTSLNTAMQFRSPEEALGRCLSIYQSITLGGMAIGALAWGALADAAGLAFALHAASGFLVAGSLLLWRIAPAPRRDEGIFERA